METPFFKHTRQRGAAFKILFSAALFIASNMIATKYVASHFGFSDSLNPFIWFLWMQDHIGEDPLFFGKTFLLWIGGNGLIMFFLLTLAGIGRKTTGIKGIRGTAHVAGDKEIKKTGLINENPKGIYLGLRKRLYLTDESSSHVLGCAPTRGGKGVAWVLPALLSWPHSVVCLDVKGENFQISSGFRNSLRHKVMKFNPSSPENMTGFNPLSEIRLNSSSEVGDAQIISEMIMNPDGKGLDDHWKKAGFSFLAGAVVHLLNINEKASLSDLARMLSDPEKRFEDLLQEMKNGGGSFAASCASEMDEKADRERSSVLSSILSNLSLYRDPVIAKNTAKSDFKVSDLMNGDRPVSLYLVLNPKDKGRMTPLIRIVLTLIIKLSLKELKFAEGSPAPSYRHKMLLLLDEFPSLGHLPIFEESLAYFAGYGIKAFIIIQNLEQLYAHYTKKSR